MDLPKVEDESNSSTAKGSASSSNSLSFLRKCSSVPRDPGLCCYNYMEPFSNDDVATEILSRLPTKNLLAFKCTAKKWNKLISDPSFLRIHYQSSYNVVGLFVQEAVRSTNNFRPCRFLSLVDNECILNLDFLPEEVVLVGSSNGIICCWSYRCPECPVLGPNEFNTKDPVEPAIYLCDPTRKEWTTVRPPQGLCINDIPVFGLASYPFGTSSNQSPSFKLVNVQCLRNDPNMHLFFIYSSDTGKWKLSNAVCSFSSRIREDMVTFANGRLHWCTLDHHVLTFDVENELSKLIKLPCFEGRLNWGTRFGESEGYLHYICVWTREIQVWVLKDYGEPAWELKHCLNLLEFYLQTASLFGTFFSDFLVRDYSCPADYRNLLVYAWSYYNEVLVLHVCNKVLLSYSFKTGRVIKHVDTSVAPKGGRDFIPTVVQCHVNLVSLGNFVEDGVKVWSEAR